jgi:dTDP-glucose 4,6-dehydratase
MPTWIVTGGAGFIGCNFVRLALESPAQPDIVVLDKLTYAGHRENLTGLPGEPRVSFVHGDIGDTELVRRLYSEREPEAVINFAAESHVDRSIDGPRAFVETNVVGAFELLEGARLYLRDRSQEDREDFRFLHVSTDEVYGSLGPTGLFTEDTRYDPSSPYSATKAAADHLTQAYYRTFGLPTLLTNCSNNYGPHQLPEKLIPLMIQNAVEGRDLPIYGDGSNVRDWIYVDDHCRGLLAVLEKGAPGETFNLGAEDERRNLEIVDLICDALEKMLPAADNENLTRRGKSSYHDLKSFVSDRPGHDQRYAIDAEKSRRTLGWRPQVGLAQGLELTVSWYLENREWCRLVQERGTRRERLGL